MGGCDAIIKRKRSILGASRFTLYLHCLTITMSLRREREREGEEMTLTEFTIHY